MELFVCTAFVLIFVPLITAYGVHMVILDYHKKYIQPLFSLQQYQAAAIKPQDLPKTPPVPLKIQYGKVGLGLSEEQLNKLQFELQELS